MDITISGDTTKVRGGVKILFFFFLFLNSYSQSAKDSLSNLGVQRNYQLHFFENYYKPIPSLINQSNIKYFTYGKFKYDYANGSLKHPQEYKKHNGFQLQTASLAKLDSTNWTLYGSLNYGNSRNEEVTTNLSYRIYSYNSPYYFFQNRTGFWNLQNYNFSVIAANAITNKLTIGTQLDYKTHFFYRKIDTRNNQQDLTILAKIAASYNTNKKNLFSLALGTEYLKLNANLSNHFPENKHLPEYRIYLNQGLGSYNKNTIAGALTKRNIYQLQAHWKYTKINKTIKVLSASKIGEEKWIDETINKVGKKNIINKYNFINQKIKLLYAIHYNETSELFLNFDFNYLNGKGKIWEATGQYYNTNFKSVKYNYKLNSDWFFKSFFLSQLGASISYESNKNDDANYGYKLNNDYLTPTLKLGFSKVFSKKSNIYVLQNFSYHHVLNLKHNPFAANNLFLDWIGNPMANYLGYSYFNYNTSLSFNTTLQNNNMIEILAKTSYSIETASKLTSVVEKKDYYSISLGINYFF